MNILVSLLPAVLVVTGIALLLLAILTRFSTKIQISTRRRNIFIAIGIFLLFLGSGLYGLLATGNLRMATPPAILGVTVRASQAGGELSYDQKINYYDENGDANQVEWELIDLSDPSQRPFIQVQDGPIDDPPAVQRVRAAITRTWHCAGHIYVATLEVVLSDKAGNRSEPVRYTIDCK